MDMLAKQDFRDAGCAVACMHEKLQLVCTKITFKCQIFITSFVKLKFNVLMCLQIDEDGNIIFEKYENVAKMALTYFGHDYNDDIKQILLDCNQLGNYEKQC